MFDRTDRALWWDAALRINSGCTKVSPGCDNCWAESESKMRCKNKNAKISAQWAGNFSGDVRLLPDNLERVLAARSPQAWAVWNDLFHESVSFDYVDDCLRPFVYRQRQLAIVLTKRIERAVKYCDQVVKGDRVAHRLYCDRLKIPDAIKIKPSGQPPYKMPDNIWLGTSAEDQERLEDRVGHLLRCQASLLFLSLEPCLGEMDLAHIRTGEYYCPQCERFFDTEARWASPCCGADVEADAPEDGCTEKCSECKQDFDTDDAIPECPNCKNTGGGRYIQPDHSLCFSRDIEDLVLKKLGWVIVGGESKGGAAGRPCNIEWVRKIVYQCKAAGVPVFVKQLHIDGKLVKDIKKFPEDLRLREVPEFKV